MVRELRPPVMVVVLLVQISILVGAVAAEDLWWLALATQTHLLFHFDLALAIVAISHLCSVSFGSNQRR